MTHFFSITVFVPLGFLPREISRGKPQRQSRASQPTVHAGYVSVSINHRTLTWTTGSLTCTQMLMRAIALTCNAIAQRKVVYGVLTP